MGAQSEAHLGWVCLRLKHRDASPSTTHSPNAQETKP